MHNPHRVDLGERKFVGIPIRSAAIIGVTGVLALATLLAFPLDLIPRLILAVLLTLVGVIFAFFKINGESPEHWVLEFFAFRRRVRHRLKGFKKVDVTPAQPAPKVQRKTQKSHTAPKVAAPPPAPRAPQTLNPVWIEVPSAVLAALVTAFMMAMLGGLTLYLASGGAEQLQLSLRGL